MAIDFLCLDSALRTGYAYREDGVVKFGTRDFREFGSSYGALAVRYEAWLCNMFSGLEPSHLAIEMPFFSPKTARAGELLHGMSWEAQKIAHMRNVRFSKHSPMTIKKFICGKGNAKKPEVTAAVQALGHAVTDDNQSDAVALLLMMEAQ